MKFADATNLYRKSGVAERFALIEKRNLEAIRPRYIRLYPEIETAGPSASSGFPVKLSGVDSSCGFPYWKAAYVAVD